ncbi:Serine carboxypeptidase-like 2 [Capsicum baccatum]|uniref:Serine carboxypeptidase-like 2 n=1 Tax=Capsicum baccatum TaxID=33114 RepID=A0A2G2WZZ3_CAPBA|nr:Serine carboxypeptidase-like 2 [Capsicum baccatum]
MAKWGPGCSALSGLLFEIGPITFEPVEYGDFKPAEYNSSFPSLVLNPHTWTKVASFIFLDLPICTGFSYARTSAARQSDDMQASDHAYQFLHKWFNGHPEFLRNSFYMAGDSYSGLGVPIVSQLIANGNAKGLEPFINLKGYLLGNPLTYHGDYNHGILYAHGMGLISDELFKVLGREEVVLSTVWNFLGLRLLVLDRVIMLCVGVDVELRETRKGCGARRDRTSDQEEGCTTGVWVKVTIDLFQHWEGGSGDAGEEVADKGEIELPETVVPVRAEKMGFEHQIQYDGWLHCPRSKGSVEKEKEHQSLLGIADGYVTAIYKL